MSNHVHLLLETPHGNLSVFMGQLLTAFTVYFNRRHGRVGHLTQGRYKSQLVAGDRSLLRVSRYIHLNPVHTKETQMEDMAERVTRLRSYRWSTYRSYAGFEPPWQWIDYNPVKAMIGKKPGEYRRYVEAGLAKTDDDFFEMYHEARLALGSGAFRKDIERLHTKLGRERTRKEDVSFRRTLYRRNPVEVLTAISHVFGVSQEQLLERRRNAPYRAAACWYLQEESGLTQREIADWVGLASGAAVGYQIQQWKLLVRDGDGAKAAAVLKKMWEPG
jgi:hypothetical protein